MAQLGRVHAVHGERDSTQLRALPGQLDVGGHQNRAVVRGEPSDDLNLRVEVVTPHLLPFVHGKHERLDQHQPASGCGDRIEQAAVSVLVLGNRGRLAAVVAPPGVVDADQYGYDIRVVVEHIDSPALLEVEDAIAAGARVDSRRPCRPW